MYYITMLVLAAIAAIAAVITVLPPLGLDLRIIGRSTASEPSKPTRKAWIALLIAIVSVVLSAGSFYYFRKPRLVEKVVERPVERVVEKLVPQKCPEIAPSQRAQKGGVSIVKPKLSSVRQSNSGGINVQQATNGQNSPIIDSPISIGSVPKHILPNDIQMLTDYLLKAKANAANVEIRIVADQYTRSSPFVDEFYTAFKDAQWPMKDPGVMEMMGFSAATTKKFKGAVVITRGEPVKFEGEPFIVKEPDPLFYIGTVLKALKVPSTLRHDQNQEQNVITIQFEGGFPD